MPEQAVSEDTATGTGEEVEDSHTYPRSRNRFAAASALSRWRGTRAAIFSWTRVVPTMARALRSASEACAKQVRPNSWQ